MTLLLAEQIIEIAQRGVGMRVKRSVEELSPGQDSRLGHCHPEAPEGGAFNDAVVHVVFEKP